ncbi:MAG: hypothetical protein ACI4VK_04395 [Candidatus Coproplasma sp.]
MRLTCILCTVNLIILALLGGVYAFTGYNLLLLLSFNNVIAMRSFLAVCAVSAVFVIYAMLTFKPFKGLK